MSGYDGSIRINTALNTKEFDKGVNYITSSLKSIASVIGVAFSLAALIKFGKEAINLASDIQEVDNVVSKAFGNMRGEMDALADTAIQKLGMSRLTAYKTGSTFMSMGKSMLDSTEDAKNMALALTELTANMSSFYNVSQDLASIALKSIYTGETETLKQYGVVMTETNLQEYAMTEGINKKISAMTQSEKVMLRYKYVTSQLAFIGNDFIDTQNSWANQTRILTEQWKEFMAVIGSGLITVLTPVVRTLNNLVTGLINFAKSIGNIMTNVFGIQVQSIGSLATSYDDAAESVGAYGDATEKAGKQAKKALAPFDDLNVLQTEQSSIGGGSVGGGFGVGIGAGVVDSINTVGKELKESGFAKIIRDFVEGINWEKGAKALETFKTAMEPFAKGFGKGFLDFFDFIINDIGVPAINTFIDIFDSFGIAIDKVDDDTLESIGEALGILSAALLVYKAGSTTMRALTTLKNGLTDLSGFGTIAITVTVGLALADIFTDKDKFNKFLVDPLNGLLFGGTLEEELDEVGGKYGRGIYGMLIGDFAFEDFKTDVVNSVKTVIGLLKAIIIGGVELAKATVIVGFQTVLDKLKPIINGIISMIEAIPNALIEGVNAMVKALNSIKIDIPDWYDVILPGAGGKSFGFNLPLTSKVKLPRLANGGITTGSTLANIGEAGREAVLPLENNLHYLDAFADKIASKIPAGNNGPVYLQIDGKTFATLFNPYATAESKRIGLSFV